MKKREIIDSIKERIVFLRSKVPIDTTYQNGEDLIVDSMNGVPGARSTLLERCQSKLESLKEAETHYRILQSWGGSCPRYFWGAPSFYSKDRPQQIEDTKHLIILVKVYESLRTPESINIVDEDGKTALHLAADKDMKEVCELLIPLMDSEAINAVTKDGKTALYVAVNKGMKEVCELLIPLMSSDAINAVTKDGKTALYIAAEKGMKEVCELLKGLIIDKLSVGQDDAEEAKDGEYKTVIDNDKGHLELSLVGEDSSAN